MLEPRKSLSPQGRRPPTHVDRSKSAAVVGAGGFIGGALSRALVAEGVHIVPITRQTPAVGPDGELHPQLKDASTIYWAASSINPRVATERGDLVAADIAAFGEVIKRLHDGDHCPRMVLLSSGGTVYGSGTPPHAEITNPEPRNVYGCAKLEMESLLHAHAVEGVVARIANAYGPGQYLAPGQGVIAHWLDAVRRREPVTVYGDLASTRDYVYIDDVTALLAELRRAHEPPAVINVGSGVPTSLGTIVDVIHDVVGTERLEINFEPARDFDIQASWLDVSLAAERFGWRSRTTLHDGIAAQWQWLRATSDR